MLSSVDHILVQMGDAKIVSELDANSGFWQIQLANESAKLTTFITPFGRYQFNKLPFGITSAPEYFQKKMGEELRDCKGVVCLMDDILSMVEIQRNMERLRKEGMTLNKDKCQFIGIVLNF